MDHIESEANTSVLVSAQKIQSAKELRLNKNFTKRYNDHIWISIGWKIPSHKH